MNRRVETENTIAVSSHRPSRSTTERVVRAARRLYDRQPDWAVFFRRVLGVDGIIRRAFNTPQAMAEFEQTEGYEEILKMLTDLRRKPPLPLERQQPSQVITVRLPKAVHEALRVEAYERRTSMNKLCISKLLQYIDGQMVPAEDYGQATSMEEEGDAADL
jgi:predicted HicB family RNase H-like nuclease